MGEKKHTQCDYINIYKNENCELRTPGIFQKPFSELHVLVWTSTTNHVLVYINHQGGTHSQVVFRPSY